MKTIVYRVLMSVIIMFFVYGVPLTFLTNLMLPQFNIPELAQDCRVISLFSSKFNE